jgi:hypothetical protein
MMTRVYLKLSFPLLVVFAVVGLAARALGGTQPTHPALRGFTEGCEGKPQPCWYGIVPAVTSMGTAKENLTRAGFHVDTESNGMITFLPPADSKMKQASITQQSAGILLSSAFLWPQPDFRLGDAILIWGQPSGVQIYNTNYKAIVFQKYKVKLLFDSLPAFSPQLANMREIVIFQDDVGWWELPWHGFVRMEYFCRKESITCS